MCGFVGRAGLGAGGAAPSPELLAQMVATLRHRGPEGFGRYRDQRIGMAHARLALVDLTTGDQPIADPDGDWWLVFNGELFNHHQLREQLRAAGRRFATASDSEVVVQAFREWGTECFRRFNGQWALALWNRVEERLVLSRDPVGICPLFVHEVGGTVTFASEVKALLADPGVRRAIDPRGIDQTFTYWSSLAPLTPYDGIEELPPGTWREYRSTGGRRDGVHWAPAFPPSVPPFTGTLDDATEALRDALTAASELRITSADVPVGAYLSGGLDSSLTALLGHRASRGRLQTFSLRFADAEFDEGIHQQRLAAMLDSTHHEVVVDRQDIATAFPEVIRHTERPVLRTAAAPMFLLSREVRRAGIKAVLTGEGADEMLAGYDLFREARIRAFWARRPQSTARPGLFDRIYPYLGGLTGRAKGMAQSFWKVGLERADQPGFSHEPRWRSARAALTRCYSPAFAQQVADKAVPDPLDSLPTNFERWDPLAQAQYLEITTLLSPYLLSSQGDRQLLGNGVEGRFPFLDPEVMTLCNSLPPSFKLRSLDEKHVLKRVGRGVVPDDILARKKQPYRAPDAICFTGPDAPAYVGDLLAADAVAASGVFEPAAVHALLVKLRAAAADNRNAPSNADNMAFVGILSTQLMFHELIAAAPVPPGPAPQFSVDVDLTAPTSGPTHGR
ncbi:MAG: asparagine synthase (glutamine-hydrolyzing) [Ilumatobacter sp.]|nr:asparagine synthase (glutamine-hydrolyzing) [Ilumatobacter sp.]MCB0983486.1 asparagine synthase (glutamine-hydrolyzing) [Ilumatobacter sp.]